MALSLRSAAFFTFASALLLGLLSPGCSQQGEGERCDKLAAGDSDCDSGLVCVEGRKLLDQSTTGRCCPPDGSYSDSRCALDTGVGASGGSGGTGAMSEAGAAGLAAGGVGPDEVGGGGAGAALPDPVAGQGGQVGTAGAPVSESGAPAGGVPSIPTAGQGGAE